MPDDHATTTSTAPTGGPNPPMGGLTRSHTDRMIGGVAGGIAARFDVDPLIVRVAFGILAVAGGSGILLYLLGWLLLPEEDQPDSIAGQALGSRPWEQRRTRSLVVAGVLAFVVFGFLGGLRPWHWSLGRPLIAVVVVLAIAAYSRRHHPGPASGPWAPVGGPSVGAPGVGDPTVTDLQPEGADEAAPDATMPFDSTGLPGASVPWSPPPEPRPPSLVPPLLGGLVTLAAISAVIAATNWVSVPLPAVLAVALLMSLAALAGGALRGRLLGAVLISLTVAGLLVLSTTVPHPLAGGIGQRTWQPATTADLEPSYRLGTGQATLDLRGIPLGANVSVVRASVGTGDLAVIVANGAAVQVRERAGIGGADVIGDHEGGVSIDRTTIVPGDPGSAPLHLDLRVGIGSIEVRRAGS